MCISIQLDCGRMKLLLNWMLDGVFYDCHPTQVQGSFILILNCPHAIGQKKKWANEKAVMYTVFGFTGVIILCFTFTQEVWQLKNYVLRAELQSESTSGRTIRSSTSGSTRSREQHFSDLLCHWARTTTSPPPIMWGKSSICELTSKHWPHKQGVLGSIPGDCRPFHFPSIFASSKFSLSEFMFPHVKQTRHLVSNFSCV